MCERYLRIMEKKMEADKLETGKSEWGIYWGSKRIMEKN